MKKTVLGLSLALLLLVGVGSAHAQTSGVVMPSQTSFTATLAIGSQGDSVTALQQFLIAKGYLQVAAPTGFYGNMTAQAVSSFQAANNLPQVGRVGPMTLALLNQQLGGGTQQAPSPEQPSSGGCSAGAVYNSINGQPCNPTSTIAGCSTGTVYSTVNGQPCNPISTIAGCSTGTVYSTVNGQPCNPTTSVFPAGCNSASGYSSVNGLPCNGTTPTPTPNGCPTGTVYSTTTGQPCNPTTISGCPAGTVYSTVNGQPCNPSSTIAGCPTGTVYSTVNGQPCNPTTIAGCPAGTVYSSVNGQPCNPGSTVSGCPAGTIYSSTTGQLCPSQPAPPSQSGAASAVTNPSSEPVSAGSTTATLTGQLLGSWPTSTTVGWFAYGTSQTSLTQTTSEITLSSITNSQQLFRTSVSGLQSNTTYYYQFIAEAQPEGMGGEEQGSVVSFTTMGSVTACSVTTPSITVVSPRGGETYTAGQQITVSWTSCNIPTGDLVNINLLRPDPTSGSDTVHVVTTPDASNTFPVSNGSAPITISATGVWPTTVQYGNVYKILLDVLSPSSGGMGDTGALVAQGWSANTFTINQ